MMPPIPLRFAPLCLALQACGPAPDAPATPSSGAATDAFVASAPLGFVHDNAFAGSYHFPETFGSGVALLDANGDGARDIYLVQGGALPTSPADDTSEERADQPANVLLLGDGRGSFVEGAPGAGADRGYGMGATVGDLDGDGRADLVVTNLGPDRILLGTGEPSALFRATAPDALHAPDAANWSSASGLADLDRDGHLDLVLVSYTHWSLTAPHNCPGPAGADYCDVSEFEGAPDRVLLGDGTGAFRDATADWGLGARAARGLGLALVDFDEDGDVDLYVANDTDPNAYWENDAGARFVDRTLASGASANLDGRFEAGMGVAIADVSDDGRADILVTNFSAEPHALYVNRGGGRFRESSRTAGIAAPSLPKLSFGAVFGDFDLNGFEDLFTASGHVLRNAGERTQTWAWKQPDLLMLSSGPLAFEEHAPGALFATPRVGRGTATGDLDGDGRLDLVVTHSGDEALLGFGRLARAGDFLGLELVDPTSPSNRMAIGARVTVTLSSGRTLVRWLRAGSSYLSQDDQRLHFGIPTGATVAEVEVRWPDGTETRHGALEAGRWQLLERP